jgi:penicillin amidase
MTADGEALSDQTWGKANTLAIEHPLSQAVPLLGRWLNMPAEPMDGDTFMPLVQTPTNGASQRMVVAPGHEENGIFHMATGQSGHPLSPYYSRGHRDWVEGRPSNFLPGPTQWRLELVAE